MMQNIAVFPGSFDPVTRGHESVVRRALPLFDKIIIAIGDNSGKNDYFPVTQRVEWLKQTFSGEQKIEVRAYTGLTVSFCKEAGARYILRGLRTAADFEFERGIGQMNRDIEPGIETVFILCDPEYTALSSSIVREIHRYGGSIVKFLPEKAKI
jgi:pantetheine-phosphate adenylyltransferase